MAGIEVVLTQLLTLRNSVIIGTSLAVGIGFGFSGVLEHGASAGTYPVHAGFPGTALTGVFLNLVLPSNH